MRTLLDMTDHLTARIDKLASRITHLFADHAPTAFTDTDPTDGTGQGVLVPMSDTERPDEIPGIGPSTAQVILAETGTRPRRGLPDPRAPDLSGETVPTHHPVRQREHLRQDRQGQPLAARRARRGRDLRRPQARWAVTAWLSRTTLTSSWPRSRARPSAYVANSASSVPTGRSRALVTRLTCCLTGPSAGTPEADALGVLPAYECLPELRTASCLRSESQTEGRVTFFQVRCVAVGR